MADSPITPKAFAVGVVYSADGWPRIDPDFIEKLSAKHRKWVESDLAKHGFRLNGSNFVEEIR